MARGGGDLRAGGGVVALGVGGVPVGAAPLEVVTLIITVLFTYHLMTKTHVRRNHGVATTQLQAHVMPLSARIEMQADGGPITTNIRQRNPQPEPSNSNPTASPSTFLASHRKNAVEAQAHPIMVIRIETPIRTDSNLIRVEYLPVNWRSGPISQPDAGNKPTVHHQFHVD